MIYFFSHGDCLLRQCSQILEGQESWSNTNIILPTERLGTLLLAALGKKRNFSIPPKIYTLNSYLFHRLEYFKYEKLYKEAGSFMKEYLFKNICESRAYRYIQPHHSKEWEQIRSDFYGGSFFGERLKEIFDSDIHRQDFQIEIWKERFKELEDLWQLWPEKLKLGNFSLREEFLCEAISWLAKEEIQIKDSEQELWIVGLTTAKSYWHPLFKVWKEKKSKIFLTKPFTRLLVHKNPLKELTHIWDCTETLESSDETKTSPLVFECKNPIGIHHCPTLRQEIEAVWDLIENYYYKKGISWSQMSILLTDEALYGPWLRMIAKERKIPINPSFGIPWSHTPWGLAMMQLMRFKLHGSMEIWENPSIKNYLKKQEDLRKQKLERFWSDPLTLDSAMKQWESLWLDFFSESESSSNEGWEIPSKSAAESFLIDIRSWLELGFEETDKLWTPQELWNLCSNHLFTKEVRQSGFPMHGVQILRFMDSRHLPMDIAFIMGSMEGLWPKKAPHDVLLNDYLKENLGISGWRYVEALEETTWRLLCARVQHVHIFWNSSKNQILSRYGQMLQSSGQGFNIKFHEKLRKKDEARAIRPSISSWSDCHFPEEQSMIQFSKILSCPFLWQKDLSKIKNDSLALQKVEEKVILNELAFCGFKLKDLTKLQHQTDRSQNLSESWKSHLNFFLWPKFIKHFESLEPSEFYLNYRVSLDYQVPNGPQIKLNHYIDRLDCFPEGCILTFFIKNDPPKDIASQLPIFMSAEVLKQKFKNVLIGYWSFKNGWSSMAVTASFKKFVQKIGLISWGTKDYEIEFNALTQTLEVSLAKISQEGFFPKANSYCSYCSWSPFCRIEDPKNDEKLELEQPD